MITLQSKEYEVIAIKKRSSHEWLKNVQIGHVIRFVMPLKSPGRSSNGIYATYVTVENVTLNTSHKYSLNTVNRLFDVLELHET